MKYIKVIAVAILMAVSCTVSARTNDQETRYKAMAESIVQIISIETTSKQLEGSNGPGMESLKFMLEVERTKLSSLMETEALASGRSFKEIEAEVQNYKGRLILAMKDEARNKPAKTEVSKSPAVAENTKQQGEIELQKEMEAMMSQQLAAEANSRSQHASATPEGDIHKYAALIKATVERYMVLDPTMRGKTCTIGVKLASSGHVISVNNGQGDPAVCLSGKAAVLKANQLPVPKDPKVFEMLKEFNLKLEPNI